MTLVRDTAGQTGILDAPFVAGEPTEVRLASGARVQLAAGLVEARPDGSLATRVSFADIADGRSAPAAPIAAAAEPERGPTETFQEVREELRVSKAVRETDRIRVSVHTATTTETVTEPVWSEAVEVRRVPVGETVTEVEDVRSEGGVTIVPVYEEVFVVERRLVLRERLHVTLRREETEARETITLRHQTVEVDRLPVATPPPGTRPA